MAKGSFGDTALNALGYPVGIANLLLATRGGNLYNQLIARNQALQDPAQRQAMVGNPFSSGMMLVHGGQPPNPLTPEFSLEGVDPGSFFPSLPQISPEDVRERHARFQIPLTPEEAAAQAAALVSSAKTHGLPEQGFSNMGISPGGNPFITTQVPYSANLPEGFGLGPRGEALKDPLYGPRLSDAYGANLTTPPPPGATFRRSSPSRSTQPQPTPPVESPYRIETTEPPDSVTVDEQGNRYPAGTDLPFAPGSGRVDSKGRLILGQEASPETQAAIDAATAATTPPATPPTTVTTQPRATEFDTSLLDPTKPIPLPDQLFGPRPTPTSPTLPADEIPATPTTPTSEIGYPPPQSYGAPIQFGPRQLRPTTAPDGTPTAPPSGIAPGGMSLSSPALSFPPPQFVGKGEQLTDGKKIYYNAPGTVYNLPNVPTGRRDEMGNVVYEREFPNLNKVDLSDESLANTVMVRDGLSPRNAYHRMIAQISVANIQRDFTAAKKAAEDGKTTLPEDTSKAIQMIFVANESILRLQQMHPSLVNKWVGPINYTFNKAKYYTPRIGMFKSMSDQEAQYFASFSSDLNALMPIGWSVAGANFTTAEMDILKSIMPTGSAEINSDIFKMRANKYQENLAIMAKTRLESLGPKLTPWMRQSLEDVTKGRSLFEPAKAGQ